MPIYLPAVTAASGHAFEVWGCVRPAHYAIARASQVAQIQFASASSDTFRTIKRVPITDSNGYFDTFVSFPSSGYVRIAWTYPRGAGGGRIHSRTVQITIR
jgi:hypothetical protein